MAVNHRGFGQGRLVPGFVLFLQLRFLVPHPDKCSSCDNNRHSSQYMTKPDIPCTRWSSRPDTVFLLESWGLLIDLPCSKLHTAPGYCQAVCLRCCFPRICYYDQLQNWTVHILFRQCLPCTPDDRLCSFSTVDCPVDIGSCCRCQERYNVLLLCVLFITQRRNNLTLSHCGRCSMGGVGHGPPAHNAFGPTNNWPVCSLILRKISKLNTGTARCQVLRLKYIKVDFRWGGDSAGEARLTVLPQSSQLFQEAYF